MQLHNRVVNDPLSGPPNSRKLLGKDGKNLPKYVATAYQHALISFLLVPCVAVRFFSELFVVQLTAGVLVGGTWGW